METWNQEHVCDWKWVKWLIFLLFLSLHLCFLSGLDNSLDFSDSLKMFFEKISQINKTQLIETDYLHHCTG